MSKGAAAVSKGVVRFAVGCGRSFDTLGSFVAELLRNRWSVPYFFVAELLRKRLRGR